MDAECRSAARGCVDCKKHLIRNMNAALEPVRARRAEITAKPGYVRDGPRGRGREGPRPRRRDDAGRRRRHEAPLRPAMHFAHRESRKPPVRLSPEGPVAEGIRIPIPPGAELVQPYPVHVPQFEGPLDLLLHLIRKNEVDLRNIPVADDLPPVPRVPRAHAGARPRGGGRVPLRGGAPRPDQEPARPAARTPAAGRRRGSRPARGADREAPPVPEVQGGRRDAPRLRGGADRDVPASRRTGPRRSPRRRRRTSRRSRSSTS